MRSVLNVRSIKVRARAKSDYSSQNFQIRIAEEANYVQTRVQICWHSSHVYSTTFTALRQQHYTFLDIERSESSFIRMRIISDPSPYIDLSAKLAVYRYAPLPPKPSELPFADVTISSSSSSRQESFIRVLKSSSVRRRRRR